MRRLHAHLGALGVTARQWRILGALGVANLVDNYDGALLGLALPQIQAGLMVSEETISRLVAIIRLGVLPAILLAVWADHIGRRVLLLATITGFTVCTFLTALVSDPAQFTAAQFAARAFIAAENMLAVVVIAEELAARNRGWGIGVFGALGAWGYGLASLVFAFVNVLPFGWRALYILGIAPLLLIAWFRRTLPETERFAAHRVRRGGGGRLRGLLRPVRNLLCMYPGRMLALCGALFPFTFVTEPAMFFPSKFLQDAHGYTPGGIAAMYLTIGVLALVGNIVAGALGDRFGRRRMLVIALLGNGLAAAGFYNLPGWIVPLLWGLMVLTITMIVVLFGALGSELFPTSYRSTASGVRGVVATLGAAGGFWLESAIYPDVGSHAAAITAMLVAVPIAPLVIALFVPETANRELEEVSPERE